MKARKLKQFFLLVVKYKFWVTILFFIFWLFFLDSNNYFFKKKIKKDISQLKEQKKYYLERIQKDSIRLNELKQNNSKLERFAREKYLMKKENEDLFIIIESK